jgi:hypothetical protein
VTSGTGSRRAKRFEEGTRAAAGTVRMSAGRLSHAVNGHIGELLVHGHKVILIGRAFGYGAPFEVQPPTCARGVIKLPR